MEVRGEENKTLLRNDSGRKELLAAHECCTKGQKQQQTMTHPIVELFRIKAASPKLADSNPNETTEEKREIYETTLAAPVAVMLSSDLQQQYETGNSARHFTQFFLRFQYGRDVTV